MEYITDKWCLWHLFPIGSITLHTSLPAYPAQNMMSDRKSHAAIIRYHMRKLRKVYSAIKEKDRKRVLRSWLHFLDSRYVAAVYLA